LVLVYGNIYLLIFFMKIAHLISNFPPYYGGMGNVCEAEVEELAKLGHEVVVFTPGNPQRDKKKRNLRIKHIKPLFKWGNAAYVPRIVKELDKFDIIHLHWPFLGGAEKFLLWYKKSKQKPKLVVQYHMDLIAPGLKGLIFKLNLFLFHRLLVKKADKILISSLDYLKNSQISKYWEKHHDKFFISPFGVNQNKFFPEDKNERILKKHYLNFHDKIVLFVGGLDNAHYFKGVDVLIKALKKLEKIDEIKLLIVGEGDLRKKYEKLTRKLDIDNKVFFAGRIENKDKSDYYNLADVFVLPSVTRSEAFGLVSVEAMACGKPIIISNLPGPRSLVESNGLIVKVNDVDDLAEKIKFIFSHKEKIDEFGQKSLQLAQEKYYWPKIVEDMAKIYEQVVNYKN